SAKRFGPAGATVVLAVVVTLAAGVLYGARRWFPSVPESSVTTANDTAVMSRQPSARKTERVKTPDTLGIVAPRTRSMSDEFIKSRVAEKGRDVPGAISSADRKPATVVRFASLPSREPAARRGGALRNSAPRLDAPSIRFPQPGSSDNSAIPSPESRNRSYGPPHT